MLTRPVLEISRSRRARTSSARVALLCTTGSPPSSVKLCTPRATPQKFGGGGNFGGGDDDEEDDDSDDDGACPLALRYSLGQREESTRLGDINCRPLLFERSPHISVRSHPQISQISPTCRSKHAVRDVAADLGGFSFAASARRFFVSGGLPISPLLSAVGSPDHMNDAPRRVFHI